LLTGCLAVLSASLPRFPAHFDQRERFGVHPGWCSLAKNLGRTCSTQRALDSPATERYRNTTYGMSQAAVQVITAGLDERLAARFEKLSPGEQRVARFFDVHREEAAFLSVAEIASQLDTSTASVVRAAQSLGYAGLPDLKRELIEALRSAATPALRMGRSLEQVGEDPHQAFAYMLSLHAELMDQVRRANEPRAFGRAVDLIHTAKRTLAYGVGPSTPLADYLVRRLRRIGRPAVTVADTGFNLADSLMDLRTGDVVFLIAYGRVQREAESLLRRAKALQLPVVLLTDSLGFALAERIAVSLSAPRGRTGMLASAAAAVVVLDALLLGVAAADRPRSLAALEELNDLRADIVGYRVDIDQRVYDEGMPDGA
jgi:DNA-binding MurR/RpiR family transcriptional regulator